MTPPYEVRMIHAVRCPHKAPEFGVPRIERLPGDPTYELVDAAVGIHSLSTASVYVDAEWSTVVDDLASPGPIDLIGRSVLEQSDEDRLAAWGDASTGRRYRSGPASASATLGIESCDLRRWPLRALPATSPSGGPSGSPVLEGGAGKCARSWDRRGDGPGAPAAAMTALTVTSSSISRPVRSPAIRGAR